MGPSAMVEKMVFRQYFVESYSTIAGFVAGINSLLE